MAFPSPNYALKSQVKSSDLNEIISALKSGTEQVSPWAGSPAGSGVTWSDVNGKVGLSVAGDAWNIPIVLTIGVRIKVVELWCVDNASGGTVSIKLWRVDGAGATQLGTTQTSVGDGSSQELQIDLAGAYETVVADAGYHLECICDLSQSVSLRSMGFLWDRP